MPDIIQSMLIKVGLDLDELKKGQSEANDLLQKTKNNAEAHAKKIEESGKRAAEYFSRLKDAALEFLTVFTAGKGFSEFLKFINESDAAMTRMARAFGISAEELGAWGGAAQAVGGTMEGMERTIGDLITRFEDISITGDTSIIQYFYQLGIQVKKTKEGTLDFQAAFLEMNEVLMDRIKKGQASRAQAAVFLSQFIHDPGAINLLLQEHDVLLKLVALDKKYAAAKEDEKAAIARQEAFAQLNLAFIQVGRSITTFLTPALLKIAEILNGLADWALAHPDLLHAMFIGVAAVIGAITIAITAMSAAWVAAGIVAAFALLSSTVGIVVLAILSLVAATTYVILHWQEFKDEAIKLWEAVGEAIHLAMLPALTVLNAINFAYDKLTGRATSSILPDVGDVSKLGALEEGASKFGLAAEWATNPIGAVGGLIGRWLTGRGGGGGDSGAVNSNASTGDHEAYIREAARKRGIDPDVAVRVARTEGLGWKYANDEGSSFGDFQLHMGGISRSMPQAGMGDDFKRDTGLDPRDPTTWQKQIDYALDKAAKNGWGRWMGARDNNIPQYAGIGVAGVAAAAQQGGSGATTNTTTTVTNVGDVNLYTPSTNPADHVRMIRDRVFRTSNANGGSGVN